MKIIAMDTSWEQCGDTFVAEKRKLKCSPDKERCSGTARNRQSYQILIKRFVYRFANRWSTVYDQ